MKRKGTKDPTASRQSAGSPMDGERGSREGERYYRSLLHSMVEDIMVIDRDYRITDVNNAFLVTTGHGREDVVGRHCHEVLHGYADPCDSHGVECLLRRVFETARPAHCRHEHRCKDGSRIWVDLLLSPMTDDDGSVTRVIKAARDVSDLVQAQEALREGESRYRALVEDMPALMCRFRPDGTLTFVNDAYCKYFGKERAELTGQDFCQFIPEEERQEVKEHYSSLTADRPVVSYEHRAVASDGTTRYQRWTDRLLCDERDRPVEYQSIGIDITERKRAEEALWISYRALDAANRHGEMLPLLQELVAELKSFTGCAAVGVRILGPEGNIPYQAYDGFSREFYTLESPLSIERDRCMCINVVNGTTDPSLPFFTEGGSFYMNGTTRFLATVPEKDKGTTRNACNRFGYESVALAPIRLGGRILGLIHVADPRENMVPLETVEVLERVGLQLGATIQRLKSEKELREYREHLEQLVQRRTAALRRANEDLQAEIGQRKRAQDEVQQYQAHLRSLASELALVEERERRRIASALHDHIGQTLALSKIKLGGARQAASAPDVVEPLDEVRELLEQSIEYARSLIFDLSPPILYEVGLEAALARLAENFEKRHSILTEFKDDGRPKPLGDDIRVLLFQSARELLMNVVKHAKAHHAKVAASRADGQVRVTVEDDGVGFDPGEIGFHVHRGGGFGLFSIRERLDHLGGRLEIVSQPGQGTAATLVAPLREEQTGA